MPFNTCMRLIVAGFAAVFSAASALADDVIKIRLSYKVILDPATGLRPAGVTDADIDQAVAGANDLLKTYNRGYRLVRVGPVADIGGVGGFNRPNPSYYYGVDFENAPEFDNLDADAHAHPGQYAWNFSAINLFIVPQLIGGHCSNPSTGRESIFIGTDSDLVASAHLHEISHFFSLCHTQGCPCSACGSGSGECNTVPGDDEIADTLPDLQCWTRDDIATNFPPFNGRTFDQLNQAEQELVNDVFYNLMSYHRVDHPPNYAHTRQTEDQLDLFADWASGYRTAVRDGSTIFVDRGAGGTEDGSSTSPFNTVAEGLGAAGATDIVLIRPGTYSENLRIRDPVTLRVPRTGTARIGTTP
jgi:hypothetical protein